MYRRYIIVSFCALSCLVAQEKEAPVISLTEKNKEADTAYLSWKLAQPTFSPELKKLLTPEAQVFLVSQSQLPFDRYISKQELKEKVAAVLSVFKKRYPLKGSVANEMQKLITKILVPEYILQDDPQRTAPVDKAYNTFISELALYKTTVRTTLAIWALRFLTSESQIVALATIKRQTRDSMTFSQLPIEQQKKILSSTTSLIVERFMANLRPAREIFKFSVPPHLNVAIKKRINEFLIEKFLF